MIKQLVNQFKLGDSLFKFNHRVNHPPALTRYDRHNHSEVLRDAEKRMALNLAEHIVKNKMPLIRTDSNEFTEFGAELLVLRMEDFKSIVEAAIQMMPEETLVDLRRAGRPNDRNVF